MRCAWRWRRACASTPCRTPKAPRAARASAARTGSGPTAEKNCGKIGARLLLNRQLLDPPPDGGFAQARQHFADEIGNHVLARVRGPHRPGDAAVAGHVDAAELLRGPGRIAPDAGRRPGLHQPGEHVPSHLRAGAALRRREVRDPSHVHLRLGELDISVEDGRDAEPRPYLLDGVRVELAGADRRQDRLRGSQLDQAGARLGRLDRGLEPLRRVAVERRVGIGSELDDADGLIAPQVHLGRNADRDVAGTRAAGNPQGQEQQQESETGYHFRTPLGCLSIDGISLAFPAFALCRSPEGDPMLRTIAALLITAVSAAAIAQTPANPPVRIRGTVERIDRTNLTVKTNSGQSMNVKLADNFVVIGIAKASLSDVASGKFIGTTTVGERDGALVALEVHIFPENMRGTGEGHYDWDLRPASKMTNANVANVTNMGKDRVLTVQYKGGEKKVLVPENAVVVAFKPADKSELKPGAQVFVNSQKQPDGSLTAPRVNVGLKGQVPPM